MIRAEDILSEAALTASLDRSKPVPFVQIQPFFREDVANALHDEFPDPSTMLERYSKSAVLQDLATHVTLETAPDIGPMTARLAQFIYSSAYAAFVHDLTGFDIDPMLCQPTYNTYHPGQHLDTHIDHRRASTGFVRPVTQVIHLTKGWQQSYGGEFSLSTREDLSDPILTVTPGFNTAVIFERTPDSWHGVTRIDTDQVYRKTLVVVTQRRDWKTLAYAPKNMLRRLIRG